jgi:hypothetical protein
LGWIESKTRPGLESPLAALCSAVKRIEDERAESKARLDLESTDVRIAVEADSGAFSAAKSGASPVDAHFERTLALSIVHAKHQAGLRSLESVTKDQLDTVWADYLDATRDDDE